MNKVYATRRGKLVSLVIVIQCLVIALPLLNQAWHPVPAVVAQTTQSSVNQQRENQIREHEAQMKNLDLERTRSRDPQIILAQVNEDFSRIKALDAEVIQAN